MWLGVGLFFRAPDGGSTRMGLENRLLARLPGETSTKGLRTWPVEATVGLIELDEILQGAGTPDRSIPIEPVLRQETVHVVDQVGRHLAAASRL